MWLLRTTSPLQMPMKAKINTSFLVYRPVIQYEESIEPYLICSSKVEAETIVETVKAFLQNLFASLPESPEIDGPEYLEIFDKRTEIINSAQWPFGLNALKQDLNEFTHRLDLTVIAYQELPLIRVLVENATDRTDREIVVQTCELAKAIAAQMGFVMSMDNAALISSKIARVQMFWRLACIAQEHLTQTEVENALANIEELPDVRGEYEI